jgi:hypothetical protein
MSFVVSTAAPALNAASSASAVGSSAATASQSAISSSAVSLAASAQQVTPDAMANSGATLVGAIVGAVLTTILTYLFQHWFAAKQERKQAKLAAHKTMFALLQQVNTIVLIQRDFVEAELDNPVRYITIRPSPPFDATKNLLRIEDLTFMLDSSVGRAILYDLYLAQENYLEAINQWNLRSSIHVEKLQPALAALNIPQGTEMELTQLEMSLGPLLVGTMRNHTTNCLVTLRRAFEKLAAMNDRTRAFFVETFKSEDFTKFDFPNTHGLTNKNPG